MNFRPELAEKVIYGRKTVTRRLTSDNPRSPWWKQRSALLVGQDVAICPGRGKHAIGRAEITSISLEPLGYLTDLEAQHEGFEGGLAFQAAWEAINGSYDPKTMVWRIGLRSLREPCPVCRDDGWAEQWTEDDHVITFECPRLNDPGHAPFNATGILPDQHSEQRPNGSPDSGALASTAPESLRAAAPAAQDDPAGSHGTWKDGE